MLHLPALAFKSEDGRPIEQGILKVHNAAQKLNLAVRGMHGESSRAEGDFFQISNQVTLGKSPAEAVGDLQSALPQIIEYERQMRDILMKEDRSRVEDVIWRAWALLTHARRISSAEALAHLSALRLGAYLGIITTVPVASIHGLMVSMRPGHLQHRAERELSPVDRDVVRAELIRDTLKPPAC
jgi:protein arginine kinase